jgi:Icc-related predicted phosphoesterase
MTADPVGDTILLMSDVHAHYQVVDVQIAHAEALLGHPIAQVVVLGDFGLFGPDMHRYFRRGKRRFLRPVSFIEGNHEDFVAFDRLVADFEDIVTYLPRSSVHRFGVLRALCLGGARYMDAWSTPRGSEITEEDIAHAFAVAPGSVDVVLSHDCPSGIGVTSAPALDHLGQPGVESLARLADHLRPRLWVFGHHHRWHDLDRDGTRYLGLPQSWQGFAIVDGAGEIRRVDHEVRLPRRPRWWRLIGLRS